MSKIGKGKEKVKEFNRTLLHKYFWMALASQEIQKLFQTNVEKSGDKNTTEKVLFCANTKKDKKSRSQKNSTPGS